DIFAFEYVPSHIVAFRSFGQGVTECGGSFLACAHRIAIVLDHIDNRKFEQSCEIKRFMERTLIDGPISEIAEAAAANSLILESKSDAGAERSLTTDNAMSAPEVLVRRKAVHRAPLSF